MITKQQILDDFTKAFKEKDEIKKRTLTSIKSEILVFEKQKSGNEVDDNKLIEILKSIAKKRREAIEAFEQGGREELAQVEKEELEIIESYLPEQMSEDKVKEIISKVVADNSFTKADFGKAMGMAMGQLKGKADGNVVGKVLKEILK
jgi:uncharacterized protein